MTNTEAKRLAERKRVDEEYNVMQAKARQQAAKKAAAKKAAAQAVAPKKYPWGVSMLGSGFKNLYDTLGGR